MPPRLLPPRIRSALLTLALAPGCAGDDFESCQGADCADTTTGGTAGSGGESSGGTAGTGNSGSGGTAGTTSTTGVSGSSVGGSGGAGGTTGGTGAMGGTGGGGMGGSSGAPAACDGACGGDTPVCDEAGDTCVQCLDGAEHCEAPTPACDPDSHECVECVETNDCGSGVCDTEAQRCVDCLESEDCEAPTLLCDTEAQLCVECLGNADCTSPLEAYCDAGSCSPCQSNADCAHLTGTTVCDTAAGECVECTTAEEAVCEGNSCNPATRACTTTPVGSRDDCESCVADSECIGNDATQPLRRCVPMEFQGEARPEAYCLKRQAAGCERPYAILITAASLSGATEEQYCGIDQENVTCEAVRDLFRSAGCPGGEDAECGCPRDLDGNCTAPGQAGLCRTVGPFDNRCTYQCGDLDQCVSGRTCVNQDPDFCQ